MNNKKYELIKLVHQKNENPFLNLLFTFLHYNVFFSALNFFFGNSTTRIIIKVVRSKTKEEIVI